MLLFSMSSPKGDINGGIIIFYCYGFDDCIYASDFYGPCRFILFGNLKILKITHANNSSHMQSLIKN